MRAIVCPSATTKRCETTPGFAARRSLGELVAGKNQSQHLNPWPSELIRWQQHKHQHYTQQRRRRRRRRRNRRKSGSLSLEALFIITFIAPPRRGLTLLMLMTMLAAAGDLINGLAAFYYSRRLIRGAASQLVSPPVASSRLPRIPNLGADHRPYTSSAQSRLS